MREKRLSCILSCNKARLDIIGIRECVSCPELVFISEILTVGGVSRPVIHGQLAIEGEFVLAILGKSGEGGKTRRLALSDIEKLIKELAGLVVN